MAGWQWKPIAAVAGLMVVVSAAWWLNVPAAQNDSLARALRAIAHRSVTVAADPLGRQQGPMVEVTPAGIPVVSENGGALGGESGRFAPGCSVSGRPGFSQRPLRRYRYRSGDYYECVCSVRQVCGEKWGLTPFFRDGFSAKKGCLSPFFCPSAVVCGSFRVERTTAQPEDRPL